MEISWKTTFLPFRLVGPSCSFLENEIEVPIHGIYNPHSSLMSPDIYFKQALLVHIFKISITS